LIFGWTRLPALTYSWRKPTPEGLTICRKLVGGAKAVGCRPCFWRFWA